jgi:mannose-6-phosphate isomerase-like protein (cupin superfamily)
METKNQGVVRVPPGEGETFWVLGDFVTFKADGESSSLSVFEGLVPPGGSPPPHIHYQQEEGFYVLEGTFSFLSGEKTIEADPGSFMRIPRGTLHTFKNTGAESGRVLVTSTFPGSHERFFRAVGMPVSDKASLEPPTGTPDKEKILASAERNDIHFVLPEEETHG